MNQVDDGLDWLREIRAKLAQKCDYNPYKLGEYYASLQAPYQARFLTMEDNLIHNQRQVPHTHHFGI
jgi:hypothetical protein